MALGDVHASMGDGELTGGGIDIRAEVVVRVEASPINPSDLGLLFGGADMTTARIEDGAVIADIPEAMLRAMGARLDQPLPVGNEGAGVVIAAGDSELAQSLMGKTVAILGGAMYGEYRVIKAKQCLVMPEGTTSAEGASCFVNPLTALGMTETMKLEGHKALVHTAAASNLGQMLQKICLADGVELVNIVRKPEQVEILLRGAISIGALATGFSQGSPILTHLLGVQFTNIGLARLDQFLGKSVELFGVVMRSSCFEPNRVGQHSTTESCLARTEALRK